MLRKKCKIDTRNLMSVAIVSVFVASCGGSGGATESPSTNEVSSAPISTPTNSRYKIPLLEFKENISPLVAKPMLQAEPETPVTIQERKEDGGKWSRVTIDWSKVEQDYKEGLWVDEGYLNCTELKEGENCTLKVQ